MTARFFGEYLVQTGVITSECLVSALIEQMEALPLVSKIVFENKLIPPDELVKVFHLQQEQGNDFVSACKSLGIWDTKLAAAVEEHLLKVRVPVGQILVQKGKIDIRTMTKSLDNFLAQAQSFSIAPDMEATASEGSIPSTAGSSSAEEEVIYQPGIIAELEEMFDERKRRAVKVALGFIKDKNPPDTAVIGKLTQDSLKIIRTILGLVKIFGIDSLEKIMSEMEQVLESRILASAYDINVMKPIAEIVSEAMEESWALRESVVLHSKESVYFQEPENKNRFERILAGLREAK